MATAMISPNGGAVSYQPIATTTTVHVTQSTVRGPRIRLFITGALQLLLGGLALIPVLILYPLPVTIATCAVLAFTGTCGILASCFASNKPSSSVIYDAARGGQRVVTEQSMFPRIYTGMVMLGFVLGFASAIQGIIIISDDDNDNWTHRLVRGPMAVGVGLFLALNQMLMVCCIEPMVRVDTTATEHITHIQPVQVAIPVSAAFQGPTSPQATTGPMGSPLYPYIDEPLKDDRDFPPSYNEAVRNDYTKRATAPPELV